VSWGYSAGPDGSHPRPETVINVARAAPLRRVLVQNAWQARAFVVMQTLRVAISASVGDDGVNRGEIVATPSNQNRYGPGRLRVPRRTRQYGHGLSPASTVLHQLSTDG